uniref:NADH-ubiquinone oxidoreductase chain 2 n=1 Tax=Ernobius pini TaxID=1587284 RepID=A0A343C4Q4_9COLE|nr:NADH dehydrogenase subunit 2 [Ernobius pini]
MFNLHKLLFVTSLISGTLISISSYSFMGMWMGLEINLLSIIPLMNSAKSSYSAESSIKYFITQALASTILLFSVILIMNSEALNIMKMNSAPLMMLNTSLLTKMGAAPFHFWFPEIIEGLNWSNSFILLTWQKIAPMVILMSNTKPIMFMSLIIVTSMVIGGFLSMNQVSMRKILVFSSINHMGWMISAMITSEIVWLIYFCIYSLILLIMVMMLNTLKIFFMKQLISQMKMNKITKMMFIMNFFSLGGLPPFLGFFPKWLTINMMIEKQMMLLSIIMVLLTLITLFVYARIVFMSLIMGSDQTNFTANSQLTSFKLTTMNTLNMLGLLTITSIISFS